MARQTFDTTDYLRLEVEDTPSGPVNKAVNPNGLYGAWGYVTPVEDTILGRVSNGAGGWRLVYGWKLDVANYFYTDPIPCTPDQIFTARWRQYGVNCYVSATWEFLDATGAVVADYPSTPRAVGGTTDSPVIRQMDYVSAGWNDPNAVAARLRFDVYRDAAGNPPTSGSPTTPFSFDQVTIVATTDPVDPIIPNTPYIEPTFTDVLGPTHTITVKRAGLDVGTLTAEILDADLDPSQGDLVRPGKRVRLLAKDHDTSAWFPLFSGRVVRGQTSYTDRTDGKSARVTLTACDAVADMAQVKRPYGVASMDDLLHILEGGGVPYYGSHGYGSPTIVSYNDAATLLDQVILTRDSTHGYAYVDRWGVLVLSASGSSVQTMDESYYGDIGVDFDTDACINHVTVNRLGINATTGETEEVTYGPYIDTDSWETYGPHAATFTVHGVANPAGFAAEVLAANAIPAVRVNNLVVPIRDAERILADEGPGLDLYNVITVTNTELGINDQVRVTGIEHRITPRQWTMALDFTDPGAVAAPMAVTPLPPVSASGYAAGVTAEFAGPFGTSVPGATTGLPMDLAAGVFRADVTVSGYTVNPAVGCQVEVYLDGVKVGDCVMNPSMPTLEHVLLNPCRFTRTITAGRHYLAVRRVSGASDPNDKVTIYGLVSPT